MPAVYRNPALIYFQSRFLHVSPVNRRIIGLRDKMCVCCRCVDLIITSHAAFSVDDGELTLVECALDVTVDELREITGAPFRLQSAG